MSLSHYDRLVVCAIILVSCVTTLHGQTSWPTEAELARNWPSFRGGAAGTASANVPSDWSGTTGRNILWKTPVPLPGKNSPIVWNDSVFLSGATKELQEVFCFDTSTGAIRWRKVVGNPDPAKAPKVMEDAGYAASTMATDGQGVFAVFATGNVAALDFSGHLIWSRQLGMPDNQYGYASSLAIWHDRLIIQFDQGLEPDAGKSVLLALNTSSGETIWKTPRPVANSWASPIIISPANSAQIITAANPWVIAYEPEHGAELWRIKCLQGDVAPSPAFADGLIFVAMESSIAGAIKLGGNGDVTKTHLAWTTESNLPDIVSPLATDKYLILAMSFGTVSCYETASGKKLWDHEFDGPFHASPILIGNVVHLIDRKGITARFEAAGEFKLLNQPELGEPVSATPAVANDKIYIRGESNLICIGKRI